MRRWTGVEKCTQHKLTAEHLHPKVSSSCKKTPNISLLKLFLAEWWGKREGWPRSYTQSSPRHRGCKEEIQEDWKPPVWLISALHVLSLCCPRSSVSSQPVLSSCNQRERRQQTNIPHTLRSYLFLLSGLFLLHLISPPVIYAVD